MTRQLSATIVFVLVFVGVAALTGCNATTPPVSQQAVAPAPDTTPTPPKPVPAVAHAQAAHSLASALPNADYLIEVTYNGKAMLKDGLYEEAIADSSSKNAVRLGPEPAYGDLDGDRTEDAAVTLLASSGGSGSFTYLTAVLNNNGAAKPVASILLGDRITMKSMQIVDGQVKVTWLDRRPGEPMSTAPAAEISRAFVVQRGKLVAVASPESELRGRYTWGAEVETFQPCGSKQSFWVIGNQALLQPLRDKAAELSRARGKPYQPVYVEASGVLEGKATDGFAMDYDGVYRFKAVQAINDASPVDCKAGG